MEDNDQMEFDFTTVCKCDENTKYDDLCPQCLQECLEYMADNQDDYEEYA